MENQTIVSSSALAGSHVISWKILLIVSLEYMEPSKSVNANSYLHMP